MKIKDNPIASKDSKGRLLVAAAVGVNTETIERIEMLVSAGADAVVVDTAHGHSQGVLNGKDSMSFEKYAPPSVKDFCIVLYTLSF